MLSDIESDHDGKVSYADENRQLVAELEKTRSTLDECFKKYEDVKTALDKCRFIASYFYDNDDALMEITAKYDLDYTKTPHEAVVCELVTKVYRKKQLDDKIAKLKKVIAENEIKAITSGIVLVKMKAIAKIDAAKSEMCTAVTETDMLSKFIERLETTVINETVKRDNFRKFVADQE